MKNRLNIKTLLKKIPKKPMVLRDPRLMHPEREWAFGLVTSVVVFIGAASITVYTYFKNQSVEVGIVEDATTQVVYRESLAKEVLESIRTRKSTLDKLNQENTPKNVASETEPQATTTESAATAETSTSTPKLE